MKKSTESMLAYLYDEWVANGSKPQEMTSNFADTLLCACREEVDQHYNRLGEVARENIGEAVSCKIKARLYENKSKPIENIVAFVRRACHNEGVSEAQENQIPKKDGAGRVEINPETGKAVQILRMTSGDAPTPTDDGDEGPSLFERESSTITSPADEMEQYEEEVFKHKLWKSAWNTKGLNGEIFRLYMLGFVSRANGVLKEESKYKGIADRLGMNPSTVASHIRRTKLALRKSYQSLAHTWGIIE